MTTNDCMQVWFNEGKKDMADTKTINRKKKNPDTDTFTFYNRNPYSVFTTDCVIRAISTVLDVPYEEVVMDLAKIQCETGYDKSDKQSYEKYLADKGYVKMKQPRKADNTKYTGTQFCKYIKSKENTFDLGDTPTRIIANIGSYHIVAIIDYKVYDTWNSTSGCIGNYWIKKS